MPDMILDIEALPRTLLSRIKAHKVLFREKNGSFTLTPITEKQKASDSLIGMFSDGKLSIDGYLKDKQIEKALEL